jgi:hypothetical protein
MEGAIKGLEKENGKEEVGKKKEAEIRVKEMFDEKMGILDVVRRISKSPYFENFSER